MAAISFAATNFPMENLVQVDEHMAFDEDEPDARQFKRSIVQVDLAEMSQEQEKKKQEAPDQGHHNHLQSQVIAKSSQAGEAMQFQKNLGAVQSNGDDFIFGIRSAFMYEEFEIMKTNKHNNRQRRIMVLDGSTIYHKKQCVDTRTGQARDPQNYFTMQSGQVASSDVNMSIDQLFVAGAEFQNVDGPGAKPVSTPQASLRASYDDSGSKKAKVGVMQKFQSFVHHKVFSGKSKQRFVQNILEINQLLMDNPNALDGR